MSVTSGAGSSLAGFAPAGWDTYTAASGSSVVFTTTTPVPPLPAAVNFDASIKAYSQASGGFVAAHPVDQMVELLLTVPQGTVPALGKVGARYAQRLAGVPFRKQQAVALDETNVALAALIANGDVRVDGVTVTSNQPGQTVIQVAYTNLRLQATNNTQTTPTVLVPLVTG